MIKSMMHIVEKVLATVMIIAVTGCTSKAADEGLELGLTSNKPTVTLASGSLEGTRQNELSVFKGIPYAKPPVGELRWKSPQPVEPWQGTKSAKQFGPSPIQSSLTVFVGVPSNRSEDCLSLNVWTPAKTPEDQLPVMVWIYGGAGVLGSSAQTIYDGTQLAKKGIVFVSFNYRVGPFGFLAHPELSRESDEPSGNYGMRDMIAALEWVRDNIAVFGGNPDCVTIAGESFGGTSVCVLASSPRSKGLFDRVICQSGPGFTPPKTSAAEFLHFSPTLSVAEKEGEAFLAKIKAKDIRAARALSADAILKGEGSWSAIFDGDILPKDQVELYESKSFNDTPILVGSNSDDAGMFAALRVTPEEFKKTAAGFGETETQVMAQYPHQTTAECTLATKEIIADAVFRWPAWKWASLQTQHGTNSAFLYFFDHPKNKAGHAAEIPFVFGTPPQSGVFMKTIKPEDQSVSDAMLNYWVNFVKHGDPNGAGLPEWQVFSPSDPREMIIDKSPRMEPVHKLERMEALDAYFKWRRETARK